jgi:hypothetical protein
MKIISAYIENMDASEISTGVVNILQYLKGKEPANRTRLGK